MYDNNLKGYNVKTRYATYVNNLTQYNVKTRYATYVNNLRHIKHIFIYKHLKIKPQS